MTAPACGFLTPLDPSRALLEVDGRTYLFHPPSLKVFRVEGEAAARSGAPGLEGFESTADLERFEAGYRSGHPERHLLLSLSGACNLACSYCYVRKGGPAGREAGPMSTATAREAIDLFLDGFGARGRPKGIVFFGGEPLLAFPVLQSAVEYAEGACRGPEPGFGFSLTTNGVLLDEETLGYLAAHRFTVVVSLDGPGEVHDRNRPFADGSGSHRTVLRNLLAALEKHPRMIRVRATVRPEGFDLVQLDRYFLELGLAEFDFEVEYCGCRDPSGTWTRESLSRFDARYGEYSRNALDRIRSGDFRGLRQVLSQLERIHRAQRVIIPCLMARASLAVTPSGGCYPCQRLAGRPRFSLGSVEAGLDEAARYRLTPPPVFRRPRCRDCWARYLCGGGCPAASLLDGGTVGQPDEWICAARQVAWKWALWTYVRVRQLGCPPGVLSGGGP